MEIVEKLEKLRTLMKKNGMNLYYIPTDDDHMSEYVGDYYKERAYMSGFTGSAGVLLVTLDSAYLWTDGRYFLQAEKQLEDTTITLMKQGEPGVPTVLEFIKNIEGEKVIGFDGRCVVYTFVENLTKIENITIKSDKDLVNEIWTDRPSISYEEGYELDVKYAGESRKSKLKKIQEHIKNNKCDITILSALDDIMWTLNLRGNDILYNPVILSFLIVDRTQAYLYIDPAKLTLDIKARLTIDHVILKDYDTLYKDLRYLKHERILLDKTKVNSLIYACIEEHNTIINEFDYVATLKTIKNETEVNNMKEAHRIDAVAVIKFMKWVKENTGKIEITELSAAAKLEEFRREAKSMVELSFGTIAGFGTHGAIVHYGATKETDAKLELNNLLLVDSGAHYLEGTTDITRTFVLGKATPEMKHDFTLVLKGYLALSDVTFKKGCNGATLDLLARKPFWDLGVDFNHGTGHGVGYLLNVHEGPQRIRYGVSGAYPFEIGMITSDEPGLYIEGKWGIRHESLVLTKFAFENNYGTFYQMEPITLVPFDIDGIDKSMLTKEEIDKLNNYHKRVYDEISPRLNDELKEYLKYVTREI